LSLFIGKGCYIYEAQWDCLNKHLLPAISNLNWNGVFGGNETMNHRGELLTFHVSSGILPEYWSLYVGATDLSETFLLSIPEKMWQLALCEREAYMEQTGYYAPRIAIGSAVAFTIMGGIVFFGLWKCRQKHSSEGDTELATIDKPNEKTPLV